MTTHVVDPTSGTRTPASWPVPAATHLPTVSKTANYTATNEDCVILCDASGGAMTISLPTAVGRDRKVYVVKKTDSSANAVTVNADGSETIDNVGSKRLADVP